MNRDWLDNDKRMNRRYRIFISSPHGSGFACRVCIAAKGMAARETVALPQTDKDFEKHLRSPEHLNNYRLLENKRTLTLVESVMPQ